MDLGIEPKYEYDAPQFVDFTEGLQHVIDPDADKWFDQKIADEGGVVVEEDENDQESNGSSAEPLDAVVADTINDVASTEIPNAHEENKNSPNRNEVDPEMSAASTETNESRKKQAPKNVVTSWSEWLSKCSNSAASCQATKEDNKENASQNQAKTSQSQDKRKRPKKVAPERRSARLRTLSTCSNASTCSSVSSSSDVPTTRKVPKVKPHLLTIPQTPTFMRRVPQAKIAASQAQKSREASELEVIAQKQKETHEKLKQNKVSMKKALAGQSYMPCRSAVDNLTHPKEFHFATDDRLGPSTHHTQTEQKEKDFVGTLRQHPPSPSFKNKKLTVPVPFKMTESRKRKEPDNDNNPCGQYQSMAQKVYQWQKKTPERFRVKPIHEQNQGPPPASGEKKLTMPKTPNLMSRDRKRPLPSDCVSQEEKEKLQEAEIKSYKFKATELNHKIFECNGTLGVYMIPKKPNTEAEPFHFHSEDRAEVHKTKEKPSSEDEGHPRQIKAQPVPDFSTVFKPELTHQSTHSKPFSFDQRDKELKDKKEEKIKTIIDDEKKLHEFQAQPLPSFSPPLLPQSSKCLTEPAPFNLSTENRGAVKAEKWGQKLQQEIQEERMKRVFRARPTNVLYSAPFVPDKSIVKPNTQFEEFAMNCDKRAKEREVYEMHKEQREQEEEEARKELERIKEEEEKIYLRELRKQLVHKPNPIRKYRAVEIKHSDKELTDPRSPEWQSKKRKKLRV